MTDESMSAERAEDRRSELNDLLAFGVSVDYLECICYATTASKAKWIAVNGAREAGYLGKKEWPSTLEVWRTKQYDHSLAKGHGKGPWIEDYVQRLS